MAVDDIRTGVTVSGKMVGPIWTNGRVGFHAVALGRTWERMGPFDADRTRKHAVMEPVDGRLDPAPVLPAFSKVA